MPSLIYIRLIGLTAGTLVQLFWMVVILGYRRQRNFERVFFFLCLALFCFYGGSLLALNAQIHYDETPARLQGFAITVITIGLCMVPALLLHLHMEFAETRELLRNKRWKIAVALLFYAASLHTLFLSLQMWVAGRHFDFALPAASLHHGVPHIFSYSLLWCSVWEFRFYRNAPDQPQRRFHAFLTVIFLLALAATVLLHVFPLSLPQASREGLGLALSLIPLAPLVALIYLVRRHNFLQIGRQKNLMYAVSATFLALLYLSLVRRVGGWLEPVLPPEASASILLFVLLIFIEPLQRALGRTMQETATKGLHQIERLSAELQAEARQGDLRKLIRFIERRVKDQFEFEAVWLTMLEPTLGPEFVHEGRFESYPVQMPGRLNAVLSVKPHGAMLSGDAQAALESLCPQLAGTIELCRAIEEKLGLERELAERERLAVLGQMAASISHNLKNPLGSIKTILQVQMENPQLPDSMRSETKMALGEITRLSAKLNQLLQFSRPTIRGGVLEATCDARAVIEEVVAVLRHEAERREILLETCLPDRGVTVAAGAEAVNDILSNLLVNALEATSRGGHIVASLTTSDGTCVLTVADDGPGVAAAARERMLQPFFTTKAQGTGLGLAIVSRRVADARGHLEWDSPLKEGRGTKFSVRLPLQDRSQQGTK
jgi:signal transduction histidine kinase